MQRRLGACCLTVVCATAAAFAGGARSARASEANPGHNPLGLGGWDHVGGVLGLKGSPAATAQSRPPLFLSELPATDESTPSTRSAIDDAGPSATLPAAGAEIDATVKPLPLYTPPYRGGRGLITLQGMSGMFLNPTSGTLNQGQFTAQYCVFFNEYRTDVVGHGLMLDYGVTDWLDIGLFGTIADLPGRDLFAEPLLAASGPFARIRLLKDEGAMPELSVGGIYLDGGSLGDTFSRKEVFVAGSKGFDIDRDGALKSVRFHLGARYLSRTEAPIPQDESYLYGGIELELPYAFYLIGEVSSSNLNQRSDENLPYAVGIQWKPNSVLGLSIAHMNPGGTQPALKEGLWFGIGLNFPF